MESTISQTYVDARLQNSTIILSNFGEKPKISFENIKRELMILPPTKNDYLQCNGINLEHSPASEIEKYHRMRFLLLKTGKYCFDHDSRDKQGKIILDEIGSLQGTQGNFNLFGLLYKDGNK